ncbi:hypothetical protein ACVL5V_007563 [Bradyrhizobium ottawaense]
MQQRVARLSGSRLCAASLTRCVLSGQARDECPATISAFPLRSQSRTRLRILAASSARALLSACPPEDQEGAGKAGRRLAPAIPCAGSNAHGWITGDAGTSQPSLRDGLNGVLRALLGERCTIAPVALRDDRCAHRLAATSPQGLTHRPRASGPHDFSVRAHLRRPLDGWRALAIETKRKTLSAPCRTAPVAAHGFPPCSEHRAPTPSRPPHSIPRFVTIAIRPLVEWNETGT